MAESESDKEEPKVIQVPVEVGELWNSLCEKMAGEPFIIDADSPVIGMMESLAQLSNLCYEHFIRLYIYNQALSQMQMIPSGEAIKGFTKNLPNT